MFSEEEKQLLYSIILDEMRRNSYNFLLDDDDPKRTEALAMDTKLQSMLNTLRAQDVRRS